MKIIKTAKYESKENITKEMEDFYEKRTRNHIDLVAKYCRKISEYDSKYDELLERLKVHDDSKFEEPERTPYIYITWKYKIKDEGKDFDVPKDIEDKMNEATLHHVTSNSHHPEFHSSRKTGLLNREDRDKPPKEIVDASSMPEIDIAEMVADWCAMSEEKGNSPKGWADKNVDVRWKFGDNKKNLIYELIDAVWSN